MPDYDQGLHLRPDSMVIINSVKDGKAEYNSYSLKEK